MPEDRFQPGQQIGRYLLRDRVGIGGMGEVWLATSAEGVPVAVKFAHPHLADQPYFKEFLRKEADTRLIHPNIVQTLHYFEVDGLPAIVFAYVRGTNLEKEIYGDSATLEVGRPLPVPRAIDISCDVLAALDFAHRRGFVHRDVKSSNILLETSSGKALLSDFGLVMDVAIRRTTRFGMMGGSVPYMSPEQISDPRSVDLRSDLYSFGIVLYEILTGVLPFRPEPGETEDPDYLIKHKQKFSVAVPPSQVNPLVPPRLDRIVARALEKNRDNRFPSCEEFSLALRNMEAEPLPAPRRVILPSAEFQSTTPVETLVQTSASSTGIARGFRITEAQITAYLPWALIGCSLLIILVALILRYR